MRGMAATFLHAALSWPIACWIEDDKKIRTRRPITYPGRTEMTRKSPTASTGAGVTRRTVSAGLGAAGLLAGTAPFNILRAQGAPLKVGVLLPLSGAQASIGQDC